MRVTEPKTNKHKRNKQQKQASKPKKSQNKGEKTIVFEKSDPRKPKSAAGINNDFVLYLGIVIASYFVIMPICCTDK